MIQYKLDGDHTYVQDLFHDGETFVVVYQSNSEDEIPDRYYVRRLGSEELYGPYSNVRNPLMKTPKGEIGLEVTMHGWTEEVMTERLLDDPDGGDEPTYQEVHYEQNYYRLLIPRTGFCRRQRNTNNLTRLSRPSSYSACGVGDSYVIIPGVKIVDLMNTVRLLLGPTLTDQLFPPLQPVEYPGEDSDDSDEHKDYQKRRDERRAQVLVYHRDTRKVTIMLPGHPCSRACLSPDELTFAVCSHDTVTVFDLEP